MFYFLVYLIIADLQNWFYRLYHFILWQENVEPPPLLYAYIFSRLPIYHKTKNTQITNITAKSNMHENSINYIIHKKILTSYELPTISNFLIANKLFLIYLSRNSIWRYHKNSALLLYDCEKHIIFLFPV